MNEFLAEMYGTREAIGASQDNSDVEKLAEAQILDEALRAEGVDIDSLSSEAILKIATQVLGPDSALVKSASDEEKEGKAFGGKETAEEEAEEEAEKKAGEETMEEKVAQADFLGRVMAHSYVNEMNGIEKNASKAGEMAGKAGNFLKGHAGAAKDKIVGAAKGKIEGVKASYRAGGIESQLSRGHGGTASKTEKLKDIMHGVGRAAKEHKGTAALAGGGVLATGTGAAVGAKKLFGKDKESSALDKLAEQRALEWAEAHGLVQDDEQAKLAAAVDARAYELLKEAGIDVDAIEAQVTE